MAEGADSAGQLLRQNHEARIITGSDGLDGTGLLVVKIQTNLDGSYLPAQEVFAQAVQSYADKLASESARQEATGRATGAKHPEITASAVIRAQETLDRKSVEQKRPANARESFALAGTPILSGATGVMGSYLDSPAQWASFAVLATGATSCILYLLRRRLL